MTKPIDALKTIARYIEGWALAPTQIRGSKPLKAGRSGKAPPGPTSPQGP